MLVGEDVSMKLKHPVKEKLKPNLQRLSSLQNSLEIIFLKKEITSILNLQEKILSSFLLK